MAGSKRAGTGEHITIPHGGSSKLPGQVTVSSLREGIRVDFGDEAQSVLLRITEAIELHDGDLIAAGSQWMSFEAGVGGRPPRLHVLDAAGEPKLTLTVRGSSLSVGRDFGDIVLPQDDALSELHFQLLVRAGGVFLQDLASTSGTWTVVRPSEILPSGSILAIGERLVQVSTPPAPAAPPPPATADRCPPTRVHAAA